jgi:enamine deaminase RidA (YjgF/YER057c/UK114 family)
MTKGRCDIALQIASNPQNFVDELIEVLIGVLYDMVVITVVHDLHDASPSVVMLPNIGALPAGFGHSFQPIFLCTASIRDGATSTPYISDKRAGSRGDINMSAIEQRLTAAGLRLPEFTAPAFQYKAVVVHQGVAYVSGQIPREGSDVFVRGKVGSQVDLATAQEAARRCVLGALSALKAELGSLDRVERVLKVTGFVACAAGFTDQPQVIDAASALLIDVLGDAGRHARSAIGVAELPRGVPVEIEFVVAIRD